MRGEKAGRLVLETICLRHWFGRLAKIKLDELKKVDASRLQPPVPGDGLGSMISMQVLLDNGRRIHVEIDRHALHLANAFEPDRNPKENTRLKGEDYAALNDGSKRFHHLEGTEKRGKMAKGTLRSPRGLVTDQDNPKNWKNHRTHSPHPDPFTGSPSNRNNGGGGGGGGNKGGDDGGRGGSCSGGGRRGGGDGTTSMKGTNSRGEDVQMTSNRRNGVEEIHYKATKTTKDGTTTTMSENESRVDARFGHSKYFEVEPWLELDLVELFCFVSETPRAGRVQERRALQNEAHWQGRAGQGWLGD